MPKNETQPADVLKVKMEHWVQELERESDRSISRSYGPRRPPLLSPLGKGGGSDVAGTRLREAM